ncbi:MAG TPA: 16S rRNA (guanine(527)-N(7))-methyltransferase RsmG, partial [Chloroflexi bacterium]|nr:16S rRNA (guanine(527)-N(7))-methyltransferase RsmG [Chloroflexota bacterium]
MEKLKTATLELIGITLSRYQISLLEEYEQELRRWNDRFNLTAI